MTDRSDKALLARLETAKKATPGPWRVERKDDHGRYADERGFYNSIRSSMWGADIATVEDDAVADHIAANDPATVMADMDEILKLRAEVAKLKESNIRLEEEADWLAGNLRSAMMVPAVLDSIQAASAPPGHIPTPKMLREHASKAMEGKDAA